jgi:hypothetical protein
MPYRSVVVQRILPSKADLSNTTHQHLSDGGSPVHTRRLAGVETVRPNTGPSDAVVDPADILVGSTREQIIRLT